MRGDGVAQPLLRIDVDEIAVLVISIRFPFFPSQSRSPVEMIPGPILVTALQSSQVPMEKGLIVNLDASMGVIHAELKAGNRMLHSTMCMECSYQQTNSK